MNALLGARGAFAYRLLAGMRWLHTSGGGLAALIQFNLSDIGEGIAEVQLREWHVKAGDTVQEFDRICDVESDKATVTITSRYAGVVKKMHYEVDDVAKVGSALLDIEVADGEGGGVGEDGKVEEGSTDAPPPLPTSTHKLLTTPAVRRLIKEHTIDTSTLKGSGPQGRVLKEDVLRLLNSDSDGADEHKIVPIRGYSRAMIRSMSEALTIPHFGFSDEYTMDALVQMRAELKKTAQQKGVPLSYMPFLIKATSLALLDHPILNASIDERVENIIHKKHHNISLAIDTNRGLAVPNIKHCEEKSVWEIAKDLQRLVELGRDGHFSKEDMAGGTFTLSNIGAIGGTYMKPIIFPPQLAIGAIGRVQKLPRCDEATGAVVVRSIMPISWAADHRVIDGATLARFSQRLKQLIEHPTLILAEMR